MRFRGEFLIGAMIGAGVMYLLDPQGGARRRALITDKATHATTRAGERLGGRARDLQNRSRGVIAGARSRLHAEDVSDDVLEARVRSELGHAIDYAGSLTVVAQEGKVMIGGPVVQRDADRVIETVRKVRGVRAVENQLELR
jgi:osmotically-inducible protein OsmY